MLAEGFLSVLPYREERTFSSATKPHREHTHTSSTDHLNGVQISNQQTCSAEPGPNQEASGPAQTQRHTEVPPAVSIPGSSPVLHLDPDLSLENCSFLLQYPDLQVGDSGRISHSPPRITNTQHAHSAQPPDSGVCHHPGYAAQQEPKSEPTSIPDQGYLVMGGSVNTSLDLPGSGLEPMSNSVLNGLLEKQLEEVYLQHLTDNLARCNSHLGNSLLHGLVPPPQSSSPQQRADSLGSCLDEGLAGESGKKISYLITHNLVPCSSNFSSPVLRISDAENQ